MRPFTPLEIYQHLNRLRTSLVFHYATRFFRYVSLTGFKKEGSVVEGKRIQGGGKRFRLPYDLGGYVL